MRLKRKLLIVLAFALVYYLLSHYFRVQIKSLSPHTNLTSFMVLDITARSNIFSEKTSTIHCREGGQIEWSKSWRDLFRANLIAMHVHQAPRTLNRLRKEHHQLTLIYVLESEQNTPYSPVWEQCDFAMWYNLDRSYPAPATYFDPASYLRALLAPPPSDQSKQGIVWLCSNCHTANSREDVVKKLKTYLPIDCAGACLRNTAAYNRAKSPVDLYRRYKFVICIENSNCEDYVTEKFTQAIEAGSVPIVAGAEGKPDYLRFAPRNSFVNVADFTDLSELAQYLRESLDNDRLYEQRHFRYKENSSSWRNMSPTDLVRWCRQVKFRDEPFAKQLLAKESGENKYCKILHYLQSLRDRDEIRRRGRKPRPTEEEVCLDADYWKRHFNL